MSTGKLEHLYIRIKEIKKQYLGKYFLVTGTGAAFGLLFPMIEISSLCAEELELKPGDTINRVLADGTGKF